MSLSFLLVGCSAEPRGGGAGNAPDAEGAEINSGPPAFDFTLSGVGFSSPESVLHDALDDVYLVSNVNGDPGEEDGNGFISRVSPSGKLMDLKWIDGEAPGVDLHGPKGMAIVADTLFVADIRCVRKFRRDTGAPLSDLCMDRVTSLQDLSPAPNGDLYFSDSGNRLSPGALYLLRNRADVPQTVTLADGTLLEGDAVGEPNGVFAGSRGILVAASDTGEVFRLTRRGKRIQILPPSDLELHGVVGLTDGTVLVSSWALSAVLAVNDSGQVRTLVRDVEAPADIGLDGRRHRVLIPLLQSDAVRFRSLR